MGYTTDDAYVALNKQLAAMNLLRYKWLILDNLVDRVNFTDLSCLINYGKYTVYNSTKTKQNRSSVATVSSTHAGASSARPSPPPSWGTGPPATKERIRNSAGRLPRCSQHSLPTSTLIDTLDGSLCNSGVSLISAV